MPQEFLWSFRRAGEEKFMKVPSLSSPLPWIVHRGNWKALSPGLFRLSGHIVGWTGKMYQSWICMSLDTPCRREGSEGSKGSKGSEGGGGCCAAIFKVSVTGLAL